MANPACIYQQINSSISKDQLDNYKINIVIDIYNLSQNIFIYHYILLIQCNVKEVNTHKLLNKIFCIKRITKMDIRLLIVLIPVLAAGSWALYNIGRVALQQIRSMGS